MSKSFQKWMIDNGNAISTFSSSTKKTVNVLKGLCASLASMGADMIITMGLNGIVTFIDNYANRVKYAQEGLENFNSNVTESKKNLETQKNWIEEHGERYVELSRGVDNYGKNVSLTADEMSEYNSLTKDIESMFPNMISGYNDQNQAIVKMKGSVDELTESYKTNVEAAYSSTLAKSSKGFNDYKTAILLPKNRKEQISEIISSNTKLKDVVAVESPFVNDGENGLIKDVNGFITGIDTDILDEETIKQLQEETKNSEKTFDQLSSSLQQKIRAALTTANATIKSETSKVKPILEAFVYANGGKDSGFDSLDKEGKQVIRNIISCLDDNFYKQFDSDTDMASYFYSYFIDPLKDGLDNTDVAVKINTLFSINQNDYESYQDYINAVNRIINQIKELKDAEGNPLYSEDQINGLQNVLGIGKITNNGQLSGKALIDTIKGKYSGISGADDYIETLNEEELRVLYDLKPDERFSQNPFSRYGTPSIYPVMKRPTRRLKKPKKNSWN